jgi:hypothetical protein
MAGRTFEIGIKTTADTSGATQAQRAIDELNPGVRKLGTETETSGKNVGKLGMLTNQAGYQLGDFFTQVEMGTGVVRAFSQQAGQMAGALSSAGVLSAKMAMTFAGIGAALPIVAIALPIISDAFSDVSEKVKRSADEIIGKLKEISDKAGKETAEELQRTFESAENAAQAVIKTAQSWDTLKQAEEDARTAGLSNAQKVLAAQDTINTALGLSVDLTKEKLELERQSREEAARQNTSHQVAGMAKAVGAVGVKAEELSRVEAEIARLKEDAATTARGISRMTELIREEAAMGSEATVQALEKSRAEMVGKADATSKRIAELQSAATNLETAVTEATNTANDKIAGAQKSIERIAETLQTDELVASAAQLDKLQKEQAATLKETLANIQPVTAAQQAAFQELQQIASDGLVTANETQALGANLSKLIGGVQVGITGYNGNVAQLIAIVTEMNRQQRTQQSMIDSLQLQVRSLK